MKTIFDGDICKIKKGVMVMAHDKKEGTLHMTLGSGASISIASSELDIGVWHRRLGHMSEKRMKVILSKNELSGLKSIDLDFCEECVHGKQRRVGFSKARKTLKAKKL